MKDTNSKVLSCLVIISAILFCGNAFAQKLQNTDNDSSLSSRTGSISVSSYPPGAKVYVDSEFIGYAPLSLHQMYAGNYLIRLKLKGHADYQTMVKVFDDQNVIVNAKMSRELYELWMQGMASAITSSIILPGKGQVDNGQGRGWLYFSSYFAAAGFAYYHSNSYKDANNKFNLASALYSAEEDPALAESRYLSVRGARQNMADHKRVFEYAVYTAATIWTISMLDVIFFTIDRPILEMRHTPKLSIVPRPWENQIGLQLRF